MKDKSYLHVYRLNVENVAGLSVDEAKEFVDNGCNECAELCVAWAFSYDASSLVKPFEEGFVREQYAKVIADVVAEGANYIFIGPVLNAPTWGHGLIADSARGFRLASAS